MTLLPPLCLLFTLACSPDPIDTDCPLDDCSTTDTAADSDTITDTSTAPGSGDSAPADDTAAPTGTGGPTDTGGPSDTGSDCDETTVDVTDYAGFCGGGERDLFTVTGALVLSDSGSDPQLSITFEKCDGSPFGATHECHVRVGSYDGAYDAGLVRTSFTWPEGQSTYTASWGGWPTAAIWEADSEDTLKSFYLICDEPGGDWNHWRSEHPVEVIKTCL